MSSGPDSASVAFWSDFYRRRDTPWDLNAAAPPLASLLADPPVPLPPGTVAVLGAGRGHDAALFARHGYRVTGFDYSPEAVAEANRLYADVATFVQADIFDVPAPYAGGFDIVVEHTCFCAIPPQRRADYVRSVLRLLKPGGLLVGLFWLHRREGGPPYGSTLSDLSDLFSSAFETLYDAVPGDSTPSRRGEERLLVLKRRFA